MTIVKDDLIEEIETLFGEGFEVLKTWTEHDRYNYYIVSKKDSSWYLECGYGRRQIHSAQGLGVDGYYCKFIIDGDGHEAGSGYDESSFSAAVSECHNEAKDYLEHRQQLLGSIFEEIS